jgi:TRAP-type C4-dicarboxylate transport system permease small subunit
MNTQRLSTLLTLIGGGALFGAMLVDTIAVIGRHIGIPLLGSIELVQVLIAVAGALSLLAATAGRMHASVRILSSRLRGRTATVVHHFNAVVSALFFIALTAGSLWTCIELWHGQEESELWHLPYRPLRLLITFAMLATTVVFLRNAWRRPQP